MRRFFPFLCLMLTMGCMVGCPFRRSGGGADASADGAGPAEMIIPVDAEFPIRGAISEYLDTTTKVEAETRVDVTSETVGKCVSVHAEEGDYVERGEMLAELDKEEALASLRETEVRVLQLKADFERVKESREKFGDLIHTQADFDSVRFSYEQALAALETQKVHLDNLTIRAPIAGVVTMKDIQVGELVSTARPVFSIVSPSSFMLVINIVESELPRLRVGQVAEVTFDAIPGETFEARVRRINPSVDPVTGSIKVVLDLNEATRALVREGAFARVHLILETHQNALLVPKDALIEESARKFLFVVVEEQAEKEEAKGEEKSAEREATLETPASAEPADETPDGDEGEAGETPSPHLIAERVEVETGLEDSVYVEVLSGVDDDTLIVTLGQHTLKPGARVKVTNATEEVLRKADLSVDEALAAAKKKREAGAITTERVRHGF